MAKKRLWRLGKDASALQAFDTVNAIKEPELLAVDRLGKRLWLSNGRELVAVGTDSMQLLGQIDLRTLLARGDGDDDFHRVNALAVHPIFGTVWIATKRALLLLDRDGAFLKQVDLTGHDLGEIEAVAFDAASYGLWIGGKKAIARFQSNGDFVARIPIAGELEAIAVAGFKLSPTLALLTPLDGLITNNAFTPLRYRLGADCTGTPCVLDSGYPLSLLLDVEANGQPLGPLLARTPYETSFTPALRWPEGLNSLSAQATDLYGHSSDRITSRFTIDTIPPKFLLIEPPDGSRARSSSLTISGSVDDATANVTLYDESGRILSSAAANFSFAVVLKPGLNTFVLTARDLAGNQASAPLRVHLGSLDATLIGLASGTIVETDRLSLGGTYLGPENSGVTVNGIVALTEGNQFYVNNLPLEPGQNTLTITVTAPDGQTVTKTVTIASGGSTPLRVEAEPQIGVAPLRSRFRIGLSNGAALSQIAIDADGDGNLDVSGIDPSFPLEYVFDYPGVYRPRILATDSNGNTWSQSITVIAQDPTRVDDFFGRLWQGMNDALVRGDLPAALGYLNETAQRQYRSAFEALMPRMAEIVASYSPPARLSADESIAEYAVSRPYLGRTRVYLVNFLRDASGVWRLDSM